VLTDSDRFRPVFETAKLTTNERTNYPYPAVRFGKMDDFGDEQAMMVHYGAIKIQSIARMIIVRSRVLKQLNERYEKIYDPRRERYYYYDKVSDKSSWGKPVLLLKSDIKIISPTYAFEDENAQQTTADVDSVITVGSEQLTNRTATDDDDDEGLESDEGDGESKEGDEAEESDMDSDDSSAVRQRRRLRRNYPR
jgi:hypothetical protein